jgi:hypothetical protein
LKLNTLYMGLESGDDAILEKMRKREHSHDMIEGCLHAQNAGLKMSVMIIIGLSAWEVKQTVKYTRVKPLPRSIKCSQPCSRHCASFRYQIPSC